MYIFLLLVAVSQIIFCAFKVKLIHVFDVCHEISLCCTVQANSWRSYHFHSCILHFTKKKTEKIHGRGKKLVPDRNQLVLTRFKLYIDIVYCFFSFFFESNLQLAITLQVETLSMGSDSGDETASYFLVDSC